jgi:5-methylcytosine-specific restriction endonuclease McrA
LVFVPTERDARFCCREHYHEGQRHGLVKVIHIELKPKAPRRVCHCKVCGRERQEGQRWLKFCTYHCWVADNADRVNQLYALACQRNAAGAGWRLNLIGYLRERDGDRCQICHRMIRDFSLPSGPKGDPTGNGPSIDHLIPRSQGGSDELANLRLTHWRCNRKRHAANREKFIQPALFG